MCSPSCVGCGKAAEDIAECRNEAAVEGLTPAEWVQYNEGTYSSHTNRFACTECYIRMGMPSSPGGWKAP